MNTNIWESALQDIDTESPKTTIPSWDFHCGMKEHDLQHHERTMCKLRCLLCMKADKIFRVIFQQEETLMQLGYSGLISQCVFQLSATQCSQKLLIHHIWLATHEEITAACSTHSHYAKRPERALFARVSAPDSPQGKLKWTTHIPPTSTWEYELKHGLSQSQCQTENVKDDESERLGLKLSSITQTAKA